MHNTENNVNYFMRSVYKIFLLHIPIIQVFLKIYIKMAIEYNVIFWFKVNMIDIDNL